MKIFTLLLFLLPFYMCGQSGFNKIYTTDSTEIKFLGAVIDNDTIIVFGTESNYPEGTRDLLIMKIDSSGNVIEHKRKAHELGFVQHRGSIIKTLDGGYLIHGGLSTSSTKGFVLKLTHNLEEAFFNIHENAPDAYGFHNKIIEVSGGYIMQDETIFSHWFDEQISATKIDYEGNVLWEQEYGNQDTVHRINDMAITNDGNIIIAGVKLTSEFDTPPPSYDIVVQSKPWYAILDSETGEILWEKYYPLNDTIVGWTYAIYPLPSGGYLMSGSTKGDYSGFLKNSISYLDSDGNFIKKKSYGPNIPATSYDWKPYVFLYMGENKYALVTKGTILTPSWKNASASVVISFDAETDEELWVRADTFPSIVNNSRNWVVGGAVFSSGSVLVVGGDEIDGLSSGGWLLKMDKNGCIQNDCETYVDLEDVREVVVLPVLFPNPTESYFSIKGAHEGAIGIYSVSGQLVKTVAENLTFGEIGVGDLPKGLYFVRGQTDGRVWVLKLVR